MRSLTQDEGRVGLLLQFAKFYLELFTQVRVQRGERFIEKQNVRFVYKSAGEGNALLLAARKCGRHFFGKIRNVHDFHHPVHTAFDFIFGNVMALESERDIVENVQMWKKRVILENGVDRPRRGRTVRNYVPAQDDFARIGFFKACDDTK